MDTFIRYYNLERTHQGYRLKGRTPAQALMEALSVSELSDIIPTRKSQSRSQRLHDRYPGDPDCRGNIELVHFTDRLQIARKNSSTSAARRHRAVRSDIDF
jgi:hypothetical protein